MKDLAEAAEELMGQLIDYLLELGVSPDDIARSVREGRELAERLVAADGTLDDSLQALREFFNREG